MKMKVSSIICVNLTFLQINKFTHIISHDTSRAATAGEQVKRGGLWIVKEAVLIEGEPSKAVCRKMLDNIGKQLRLLFCAL